MNLKDNKNIPEHWEVKNLGEVCTYSKGKKPKVPSTEIGDTINIPYINIKAFEKGIFDEYTDGEKCNLCEDGDLLMVWDGARAGFTGKAKRGAVGSTLMKIEPKDGVLKNYIFYFLLSLYKKLNTNPRGVGIPHVEPSLLWNSELIIPSFPEQQSIVSKIEELFSELDNSVAKLKLAQQQLKTYRQSVLKAAFEGKLTEEWRNENSMSSRGLEHPSVKVRTLMGQQTKKTKEAVIPLGFVPGALVAEAEVEYQTKSKLPEGWRWVKIGEICDVFVGSTPRRNNPDYWNGNINWVSSGEVRFNKIYTTREKITRQALDESSCKIHPPGTVIIAMIGEGKTRGQAAILQIEATHNQNTAAIRIKEMIKSSFLYYYFDYTYERNRNIGSGNNQKALNKERVKNIEIHLPTVKEQCQILSEIESRLSVADNLEQTIIQSLQQAEALRQSILKQAFEGRLI